VVTFLWLSAFICYAGGCNPEDLTANQIKDIAETAQYANISADIYNANPNSTAGDWKRLPDSDVRDDKIGFHAATYENANGELVIAFEGTDFSSSGDREADLEIGLNRRTQQHAAALDYVAGIMLKAKASGKKVTVTGHSLGGSLAQYTANAFGLNASTIGTAAVPTTQSGTAEADAIESLVKSGKINKENAALLLHQIRDQNSKITNYINRLDPVNPLSGVGGAIDLGERQYIYYDWRDKWFNPNPLQFHSSGNYVQYMECIKAWYDLHNKPKKKANTPKRPPPPVGKKVPEGKNTPIGQEIPTGAETPKGKNTPAGTELPKGTDVPKGAETPKGTDAPKGLETPKFHKPPEVIMPW
jgi:hypothetical protein